MDTSEGDIYDFDLLTMGMGIRKIDIYVIPKPQPANSQRVELFVKTSVIEDGFVLESRSLPIPHQVFFRYLQMCKPGGASTRDRMFILEKVVPAFKKLLVASPANKVDGQRHFFTFHANGQDLCYNDTKGGPERINPIFLHFFTPRYQVLDVAMTVILGYTSRAFMQTLIDMASEQANVNVVKLIANRAWLSRGLGHVPRLQIPSESKEGTRRASELVPRRLTDLDTDATSYYKPSTPNVETFGFGTQRGMITSEQNKDCLTEVYFYLFPIKEFLTGTLGFSACEKKQLKALLGDLSAGPALGASYTGRTSSLQGSTLKQSNKQIETLHVAQSSQAIRWKRYLFAFWPVSIPREGESLADTRLADSSICQVMELIAGLATDSFARDLQDRVDYYHLRSGLPKPVALSQ